MRKIKLGMLGGGTVGSGVYHALTKNSAIFQKRTGCALEIVKIAVKQIREPRPYHIPENLLTTDWKEVVHNPEVQIVTELVGGTTVAREMVLTALELRKPVVTANKALLATYGAELFEAAEEYNTPIFFEASVAGGIPVIKAIREGFVINRFNEIYGIVNGTCNYILTRMSQDGLELENALKIAQKLGYAEADPGLDINGIDAMHKICILASLAAGAWVNPNQIHVEGIQTVTHKDIQYAKRLGYTIKLLAVAKAGDENGQLAYQVAVYPALIPQNHLLAHVNDVYNAVCVNGDIVGSTLFYGRGAGKDATASAVISDIADAAKYVLTPGLPYQNPFGIHQNARIIPIGKTCSKFYVRFTVEDKPGVLAKIATILGNAGISISAVIQDPDQPPKGIVPVILTTHHAPYQAMVTALTKIAKLPVVKAKPVMFRIETISNA